MPKFIVCCLLESDDCPIYKKFDSYSDAVSFAESLPVDDILFLNINSLYINKIGVVKNGK